MQYTVVATFLPSFAPGSASPPSSASDGTWVLGEDRDLLLSCLVEDQKVSLRGGGGGGRARSARDSLAATKAWGKDNWFGGLTF